MVLLLLNVITYVIGHDEMTLMVDRLLNRYMDYTGVPCTVV